VPDSFRVGGQLVVAGGWRKLDAVGCAVPASNPKAESWQGLMPNIINEIRAPVTGAE
jgi:hypothetical protein